MGNLAKFIYGVGIFRIKHYSWFRPHGLYLNWGNFGYSSKEELAIFFKLKLTASSLSYARSFV